MPSITTTHHSPSYTAHRPCSQDRAVELEVESVLCLRNICSIWDVNTRDALKTQVGMVLPLVVHT